MSIHTQNFVNPVTFGHGAIQRLAKLMGQNRIERPLICTDRGVVNAGILDTVRAVLPKGGGDYPVFDATPPNPTEVAVDEAAAQFREQGCDGLISVGGGSAIDLAKGVGVRLRHEGPLVEYSWSVAKPRRIGELPPHIAIPTTAGTGAESSMGCPLMTRDGRKSVLASAKLIPSAAICDPDLTLGLPSTYTAATGMDAVTHCIEGFLSSVVNPPADAVALDGVKRAIGDGWLERAVADGTNPDARWQMMMAAQEGAIAFTKPLGSAHAMSHAASRLPGLSLNHGLLNAIFLPPVLRFCAPAAEDKFVRLRAAMGLPAGADVAEAIEALNSRIGIPDSLAPLGITEAAIPELVSYSMIDLCHRTNLRPVEPGDYEKMFIQLIAA
ncbi:iron-containing alcohol dehydrogenase [Novosphingobium sp. Gsoil 351]|uniref:iron-containing alcohol dehydrogenase n=1 Tax=Novosphingobium sp. Gsoil 351 TaxID=2675225 RepID=UPI0012B4AF68|nr:iron-containing alcohol dehydrogenase [Novosphingobium sp. Gsoil 351]QGN55500.1 iron-containing alcohol dehydrogenase [Novosphingobium sp. Gsoil 351]